MKILQVFDQFSLSHGGGTVDVIYNLSKTLSRRGHEVTIYTSDVELDKEYIASLPDVEIRPFHCPLNLSRFRIVPAMVEETRNNLRKFDVVHLHCHRSFQNIVIHHYAMKYGVPYVLDAHGDTPRSYDRSRMKRSLKWLFDICVGQRIMDDASRLIGENNLGCKEYREAGARHQERIVMITPMRDMSQFDHLPASGTFRQKYGFGDKPIVMFLGRLHWMKGLDFLVESFNLLAKARTDVTLVMVGADDGHLPALKKLIDSLGLRGRVLFTGFLQGEAKLAALVDADALVQPSIYEQGIGVPYEAVLCGTPIILTSSGAGEEVRKADTGYVVEYGDKKSLSDRIAYVLDNPAEVAVKTRKAQEYIRSNLSLRKGVEKYENMYCACITESALKRKRLHKE